MKRKTKKNVKRIALIVVVILILFIALILSLKYEKEGEKTLPFEISKILIVNTVEGEKNENSEFLWDLSLKQNNDIYIYLEKIGENEILNTVTLENFKVTEMPLKGNIGVYRPTGEISDLYNNSDVNLINHKIEYNSGKYDNLENLEVSMQGGVIGFRVSNEDIENYKSNDETEIKYDGTLLAKTGTVYEDIKFKISFDLIIETKSNLKFKGNIELEMPLEELLSTGRGTIEITDLENIVFKRIK